MSSLASPSRTKDQIVAQIQKLEELTPEQAQARLAILPTQMLYEARYALQQAKESITDPQELAVVVEPVARCVGWAEALVFTQHQNVENVRAMIGGSFPNGQ